MADKVQKTMHLKKVVFFNKSDNDFETLIRQALKKCPKQANRREESGENNTYVKVLLSYTNDDNILCGTLATYERGTAICAILENDDAEKTDLLLRRLEPIDGRNQEAINGISYIAIRGNHVVVVQSVSFNFKLIENYLNWLLVHSGVMGNTNQISLTEHVSNDIRDRIRKNPIKKLVIGNSILRTQNSSAIEKTKTKIPLAKKFWESIVGQHGIGINQEMLSQDIDFELTMTINRKREQSTDDFITEVALIARNLEEDDVSLLLEGDDKIRGDELKLNHKVRVNAKDGVPSESDLYAEMRSYFNSQQELKVINP